MGDRQGNIENQNVNETVVFDSEDIQSGQIKIKVKAYPLQESEFDRLINLDIGLKEWSKRFFLISLGALIILLSKVIDFFVRYNAVDDKNEVILQAKNYEWIALLISIALWLVLLLAGLIFKNKKDHLISKIKKHFNTEKDV
jgi:H+/gluconate symporter-like permease